MVDSRVIFRPIENFQVEHLHPPPKMTSSPIPSKNFSSDSPNKSFDKENFVTENHKTLSFGSFNFKNELTEISYKYNDEFSDKFPTEDPVKDVPEDKFHLLMEQNARLIEIVNESIAEKELWSSKYEQLQGTIRDRLSDLERKRSSELSSDHLKNLQEGLSVIKTYFYQKLTEVIHEKEVLASKNSEFSGKIASLEEELGLKKELIGRFEKELAQTKSNFDDLNEIFRALLSKREMKESLDNEEQLNPSEIEEKLKDLLQENKEVKGEYERLANVNEELNRQIKLLQEKLQDSEDFQQLRDQLMKKSMKYKSLKAKHSKETKDLQSKLEETFKELSSIKMKYQTLYKESNERIQTLSLHYEESQKSFESEIEKTYEEEKARLMACLIEERKESQDVRKKLEEKLKCSEKEINDLKENINLELEELGGKYSLQQERYKEKETLMANEIKRLNVITFVF